MPRITIYTKPFCPYCSRALSLLAAKGAEVTEIEAAFDPTLRKQMLERSNGKATYPQIFIGERHVGGCDELMALDRAGQLDPLLSA
ncbi:MAG TPA: glutaredoxin 3 [Caulobacteraceae bacterium]|nr:glutaredoxin 3 [Caulobacteraceae bacterium]